MQNAEMKISAAILAAVLCFSCLVTVKHRKESSKVAGGEGACNSLPEFSAETVSESGNYEIPEFLSELTQTDDGLGEAVQSTPLYSSENSAPPVPVTQPTEGKKSLVDYTLTSTYETVDRQISDLCSAYPDLIKRESIGKSVRGRDIYLMTLGRGEKKICVVGAMHAREHITTSYLMRCIEDYAAGYYSQSGWLDGYNVRNLLDKYTLYIVPNCNPDGTEIVLSGESPATQVITTSKGAYKANANGVNLNRNFPFGFGTYEKMSTLPHESTFPGQFAASEPETQALISLCEENSFELVLSFHIQGECVYWSDAINVNTANSELLADRISKAYGFYKCPTSTELSLFGGGFENWFRYTFSRPGFCIELMPLEYEVHPLSDYDNINMEDSLRYSHTRSIMLSAIS